MAEAERCLVRFERSGVEVSAPPGRVLLELAEDNGVQIASLCRGGTCGTCKVRVLSGEPLIDSLYALSKRERQSGWVLSCSARTAPGQRIVLDA